MPLGFGNAVVLQTMYGKVHCLRHLELLLTNVFFTLYY